jgi:hypothetical protein
LLAGKPRRQSTIATTLAVNGWLAAAESNVARASAIAALRAATWVGVLSGIASVANIALACAATLPTRDFEEAQVRAVAEGWEALSAPSAAGIRALLLLLKDVVVDAVADCASFAGFPLLSEFPFP